MLGKHVGRELNPGLVVRDTASGSDFAVMQLSNDAAAECAVMDLESWEKVSERTWSLMNGHGRDASGPMHKCIMPPPAGMRVEHTDRNMLDNRKANMCLGPKSDETRGSREAAKVISEELQALIGLPAVPKYLFVDSVTQRFSFEGHPHAAKLKLVGVRIATYGVSGKKHSAVDKLGDIIQKYHAMCVQHDALFPADARAEEQAAKDRHRLASEYAEIVAVAHAHDPAKFPPPAAINMADLQPEVVKARTMLGLLAGKTSVPVEDITGSPNIDFREVAIPDMAAVARVKGDETVLYDAESATVLKELNWECGDLRAFVTPALRAAYPCLGAARRIKLPELVFEALAGRAVPELSLIHI